MKKDSNLYVAGKWFIKTNSESRSAAMSDTLRLDSISKNPEIGQGRNMKIYSYGTAFRVQSEAVLQQKLERAYHHLPKA